jgi:hypothetical protein
MRKKGDVKALAIHSLYACLQRHVTFILVFGEPRLYSSYARFRYAYGVVIWTIVRSLK